MLNGDMTNVIEKLFSVAAISFCVVGIVCGTPKKYYSEDGNFQPSNVRYYESDLSAETNKTRRHDQDSKESDRLERFGYISSFGNTGSGNTPSSYGTSGVANPTSVKIDLGGIALGAIIGLGAILIIPKLANLFSSNYGYRSLDDGSSAVTDILGKLDNVLEQQNIDSTSCMQRIICSYVHDAQKNINTKEASEMDKMIFSITNNSFLTYMLDGSTIKQAIDMGKQSDLEKCSNLYVKCPVSKDNVMEIIKNVLPS